MANDKKIHTLQVTDTGSEIKAKVRGDADSIINAIIDCMNKDAVFRSIIEIAAAVHYFRRDTSERSKEIQKLDQTLNQQL
jgi:hypothetical protein